jgi:hypothetical protein
MYWYIKCMQIFFIDVFFSGRWYISSHGTNYLFIVHNKNRYFLLSLLKFLFENSMVTLFNICMVQVNLILHFYKICRQQLFFRKQNIAPSNPLKTTGNWSLLSIKKIVSSLISWFNQNCYFTTVNWCCNIQSSDSCHDFLHFELLFFIENQ